MDTIYIWIAVAILIFYAPKIIGFIKLLGVKVYLKIPIDFINKKEIDGNILQIISSYEKFLLEQGFKLEYVIKTDKMVVGSDLTIYSFFYYNPKNGVKAVIETRPHKNSLEPAVINYYTFYDDGTVLITLNGSKFYNAYTPEDFYIYDYYLVNWKDVYKKHLENMQKYGKETVNHPFSKQDIIDFNKYMHESFINKYKKEGLIKIEKDYYSFKPSIALWNYVNKIQKGYKKYKKILNSKEKASSGNCKSELIVQLENFDKSKIKKGNSLTVFLISGIAFISLFILLGNSFEFIVNLMLVLLIHEFGHYLAMRLFGYKDTTIFFLPFGAATVGQKREKKAYQEFIVLLAGPLPGILLGILLLFYKNHFGIYESYIQNYALISITVNYLNLLPIYPLDGGKIVETLLLLRFPKGQFYFYIIGLAVITFFALYFKDALLFIFAVFMAIGLIQSYKVSKLLSKIKYNKENLKDEIINVLCKDAGFKSADLNSKVSVANRAISILNTKKPGKIFIILALVFYLMLLLPAALIFYGYSKSLNTPYGKLSAKQALKVRKFTDEMYKFNKITNAGNIKYDMKKSMAILDEYFKDNNITQNPPLKYKLKVPYYPCKIPESLQKVLMWHNGVYYLGNINLYNDKEIKNSYKKLRVIENTNKNLLPIGELSGDLELYLNCKNGAIYDSSYKDAQKIYYNISHLLALWAYAYKVKAAVVNDYEYKIDESKLNIIKMKLLSDADRKYFRKRYDYLNRKAWEYLHSDVIYYKLMVLKAMQDNLSIKYKDVLKQYLKDKNRDIASLARWILKRAERLKDDSINSKSQQFERGN